nr:helix-turn-helix domain-containing protein [Bradyrhizobium valentinum]
MLSKRDLSIADVTLAVGFSDVSQLNRMFRKLIGVTPTAFRRENGPRLKDDNVIATASKETHRGA